MLCDSKSNFVELTLNYGLFPSLPWASQNIMKTIFHAYHHFMNETFGVSSKNCYLCINKNKWFSLVKKDFISFGFRLKQIYSIIPRHL